MISLDLNVEVEDGDNSDATSGKKVQSRPPSGNRIPLQPRYLWESLRGGFNGKVPRFVHYGHKRQARADYVATLAFSLETLQ